MPVGLLHRRQGLLHLRSAKRTAAHHLSVAGEGLPIGACRPPRGRVSARRFPVDKSDVMNYQIHHSSSTGRCHDR
jgi:hypothetical protein